MVNMHNYFFCHDMLQGSQKSSRTARIIVDEWGEGSEWGEWGEDEEEQENNNNPLFNYLDLLFCI